MRIRAAVIKAAHGISPNRRVATAAVRACSEQGQGDGTSIGGKGSIRVNLSPIIDDGSGPRPVFNDPTTANPFPNMAAATLSPSNMFDLGYTGDQVTNQPPGTFLRTAFQAWRTTSKK